MQKHVKLYMQFWGYDTSDFIPCEVCAAPAVDIHHIIPRGSGGSKLRDTKENLMALCRSCHHKADFGTEYSKQFLQDIHDNKT